MSNKTEFQKLINDEQKEVICSSCYAHYDIHLERCPYCGAANEYGMEEQYMENLEDIEENLREMGNFAANEIKKEASHTIKKVLIPIVVVLIILVLGITGLTKAVKIYERYVEKKSVEWQRENFPKLDEMYENGDYDGLVSFFHSTYTSKDSKYIYLWRWEHYQFIYAYDAYKTIMEITYDPDWSDDHRNYRKQDAFYYASNICFDTWKEKYESVGSLSKSEYETILGYQEPVRQYMKENFGIEDFDELKDRCEMDPPGKGVDYSKVREASKDYEWVQYSSN